MADEVELSTLGSVIKTAYEGEPDTNAFTDAEKTKLAGIEDQATRNSPDADLLNRANHTGTQSVSTISDLQTLLDRKVDKVPGKGLSDENFTAEEKEKLAGLGDPHFKGVFIGLAGLISAHPFGVAGDYAIVDDGAKVIWYQWDGVDNEWSPRSGEGGDLTPEQIKNYYESNANTNAFTDDEKSGLEKLLSDGGFTLKEIGSWNADTNTPALQSGVGEDGQFYVVSEDGTQNLGAGPVIFKTGDWAVYSSGVWRRIVGSDASFAWDDIEDKPVVRGGIGPAIPALYAKNAAGHVVENDNATYVPFSGIVYDNYNIASGNLFVVPEWATHARVTASVVFAAGGAGQRFLRLNLNSVMVSTASEEVLSTSGSANVSLNSAIMPVAPGDTLSVMASQGSGAPLELVGLLSWVNVELFEAQP